MSRGFVAALQSEAIKPLRVKPLRNIVLAYLDFAFIISRGFVFAIQGEARLPYRQIQFKTESKETKSSELATSDSLSKLVIKLMLF